MLTIFHHEFQVLIVIIFSESEGINQILWESMSLNSARLTLSHDSIRTPYPPHTGLSHTDHVT